MKLKTTLTCLRAKVKKLGHISVSFSFLFIPPSATTVFKEAQENSNGRLRRKRRLVFAQQTLGKHWMRPIKVIATEPVTTLHNGFRKASMTCLVDCQRNSEFWQRRHHPCWNPSPQKPDGTTVQRRHETSCGGARRAGRLVLPRGG